MNKPPAFQFYPKDFLSDINVISMTMKERGIYMMLLCYCWLEDGLSIGMPLVDKWLVNESAISRCFYKKNGKYYHKRLDEEKRKQKNWAKKSSQGGTASQQKRWGKIPKESRGVRIRKAREKGSHTEKEWLAILNICENKCVRCGIESSQLYGEKLCKDHIIPICQGGSDSIENIQPICRNCNSAKTNERKDYRPLDWKQCLTNAQPVVNSSSSSSSSNNNIKDNIINIVILYLNEQAKKHFNPKSKTIQSLIKARIKDGATLDDFKKVIDTKVEKWGSDPKMRDYLRPSTLFNATNFENYLNEDNDLKTGQTRRVLSSGEKTKSQQVDEYRNGLVKQGLPIEEIRLKTAEFSEKIFKEEI